MLEVLLLPAGKELDGLIAKGGVGFLMGLLRGFRVEEAFDLATVEEACDLATIELVGWLPRRQR